ncbi:Uncharacterised protein [Lysinibacillus sphaericus]|nr:Uncharacterised protein [Lysinibacillus sphaericus]
MSEELIKIDFQKIIKKAFDDFRREVIDDFDEYMDFYEANNHIAIENNVKDGWGLMYSFTPSEYLTPMDYDSEKRNEYFLKLFDNSDDKLLEVEFERIINYMGAGWKNSLRECLSLIQENKFSVTIPFLISMLEKVMNKTLNQGEIKWGERLRSDFRAKVETLPEDDFVTINAVKILSIFDNYIFKNQVNSYNDVPLFNRNLIQHGNDEPDRWTKVDVLKIITLIAGLIMVDEELKK